MNKLQISHEELSRLTQEALSLATSYWTSVEERPAYPATSGRETKELFSRPWAEDGLGRDVLQDFKTIANHSRPSGGKFFGYVVGSGEPVGALGDLLASVLNQNVTSWRWASAAVSIEQAVVGWLAEAVGCAGFSGKPVRRRFRSEHDGLGDGAGGEAPGQRNRRPSLHGVRLRTGAHVHSQGNRAVGHRPAKSSPDPRRRSFRMRRTRSRLPLPMTAGRAVPPSPSWPHSARWRPARSTPSTRLRTSPGRRPCGCMSRRLRGPSGMAVPEKFEGLASADSLSLDAHKWLYRPSIAAACSTAMQRLRVRHSRTAGTTSKYSMRDLRRPSLFFEESMELSRRFRALKLWMSLQYHGRRVFSKSITCRPQPCPAFGTDNPVASGTGTACAGSAQCRLFPPPGKG